MSRSLSVPVTVLRELQEHARHIEEIIATLEEFADKEGMKRIKSGLEEYEQGKYIVLDDPKKIRSIIGD